MSYLDSEYKNPTTGVKSIKISGSTGDTTFQPPKLNPQTHSFVTIDYSHHEIHAGGHFNYADVVDLSINNVRDIRITTPNTTKWAHLTFGISCESETDFYLYEDATIVAAGTPIIAINNDRNSSTTTTCALSLIDNASTVDANADTTVSAYIDHAIIGAGRNAGFTTREEEIILKQNKTYCLRFIATAAGFVNYKLEWYEHVNRTA